MNGTELSAGTIDLCAATTTFGVAARTVISCAFSAVSTVPSRRTQPSPGGLPTVERNTSPMYAKVLLLPSEVLKKRSAETKAHSQRITGVNAFHEKAGRSQVDLLGFCQLVVSPSRVATVATLPSALFV